MINASNQHASLRLPPPPPPPSQQYQSNQLTTGVHTLPPPSSSYQRKRISQKTFTAFQQLKSYPRTSADASYWQIVDKLSHDEKTDLFMLILRKTLPPTRTEYEVRLLASQCVSLDFFKTLASNYGDHIISKCVRQLSYCDFPAESTIFQQGERGTRFYIILSGSVDIIIKLPDEANPEKLREAVINTISAGQAFGEVALMDDMITTRTATVRSATFVRLAYLEKDDFRATISFEATQKIQERYVFMKEYTFFEDLAYREIITLSYHFNELHFQRGDILFNAFTYDIDDIYFVKEGTFVLQAAIDVSHTTMPGLNARKLTKLCNIDPLVSKGIFGLEYFHADQIQKLHEQIQGLQEGSIKDIRLIDEIEGESQPMNVFAPFRIGRVICDTLSGTVYRVKASVLEQRLWRDDCKKQFSAMSKRVFTQQIQRIQEFVGKTLEERNKKVAYHEQGKYLKPSVEVITSSVNANLEHQIDNSSSNEQPSGVQAMTAENELQVLLFQDIKERSEKIAGSMYRSPSPPLENIRGSIMRQASISAVEQVLSNAMLMRKGSKVVNSSVAASVGQLSRGSVAVSVSNFVTNGFRGSSCNLSRANSKLDEETQQGMFQSLMKSMMMMNKNEKRESVNLSLGKRRPAPIVPMKSRESVIITGEQQQQQQQQQLLKSRSFITDASSKRRILRNQLQQQQQKQQRSLSQCSVVKKEKDEAEFIERFNEQFREDCNRDSYQLQTTLSEASSNSRPALGSTFYFCNSRNKANEKAKQDKYIKQCFLLGETSIDAESEVLCQPQQSTANKRSKSVPPRKKAAVIRGASDQQLDEDLVASNTLGEYQQRVFKRNLLGKQEQKFMDIFKQDLIELNALNEESQYTSRMESLYAKNKREMKEIFDETSKIVKQQNQSFKQVREFFNKYKHKDRFFQDIFISRDGKPSRFALARTPKDKSPQKYAQYVTPADETTGGNSFSMSAEKNQQNQMSKKVLKIVPDNPGGGGGSRYRSCSSSTSLGDTQAVMEFLKLQAKNQRNGEGSTANLIAKKGSHVTVNGSSGGNSSKNIMQQPRNDSIVSVKQQQHSQRTLRSSSTLGMLKSTRTQTSAMMSKQSLSNIKNTMASQQTGVGDHSVTLLTSIETDAGGFFYFDGGRSIQHERAVTQQEQSQMFMTQTMSHSAVDQAMHSIEVDDVIPEKPSQNHLMNMKKGRKRVASKMAKQQLKKSSQVSQQYKQTYSFFADIENQRNALADRSIMIEEQSETKKEERG